MTENAVRAPACDSHATKKKKKKKNNSCFSLCALQYVCFVVAAHRVTTNRRDRETHALRIPLCIYAHVRTRILLQ